MSAHSINNYKVMLVDDNDIDLRINSKILTITSHFKKVITCSSGDEALTYLYNNIHLQESLPELILLDIQMPEMNGFEFLECYNKLPDTFKNNCIICMLSSTLDFGDIKKAEANPYVLKLLKKPLDPQELKKLIQENHLF